MNEPNFLDYVNVAGSIATPVLVLILTAIGWNIRVRLQRRQELEDKLREDRIAIYNAILEPFIIILMTDAAWRSDPQNKNKDKSQVAMIKMLSMKYKQTGFHLSLMGSDDIVKAYNELMQSFFHSKDPTALPEESDTIKMMSLLGTLLLEIRKGMGNETTKLDNWDMLEWFFTDARKFRHKP